MTAPATAAARDVTIAWSADTVGQGWGINPDWGGLRLYETMLKARAGPLHQQRRHDLRRSAGRRGSEAGRRDDLEERRDRGQVEGRAERGRLPRRATSTTWPTRTCGGSTPPPRRSCSGTTTRSATTGTRRATSRADAQYTHEEHGAHRRARPPGVPRVQPGAGRAPTRPAASIAPSTSARWSRSSRSTCAAIAARTARTASRRWTTRRRSPGATADRLAQGAPRRVARHLEDHRQRHADRRCVVPDAPSYFDAFANGDDGPPSGRELELADLLRFMKAQRIRNVVWVTADIHYCAAHHYHPTRAKFTEFDPFWEFVAGPLNAGTFGPNKMDATFGPEVKFTGIPPGMKPNRPPSEGFQFFGRMRVDRRTKAMTVTLHDLERQGDLHAGARAYDVAARE